MGYGYANFSRANTAVLNDFPLTAIEPNADLVSVMVQPSNKANVILKFSNTVINNSLRVSFIDQSTQQIVYQDTFTLLPTILLRIEDLTQKKTLKIMRW